MLPKIETILPHRDPILLVDEILEYFDEKSLVSKVKFRKGIPWMDSHSFVMESLCQTGGALLRLSQNRFPEAKMYFGSMENFEISRELVPGDELVHKVELTRVFENSAFFSGESFIGFERVARLERALITIKEFL